MGRRYCLITPCRDEGEFARVTLDCVVAQSERPDLWVIVDDGSKDQTPQILAEYAASHDWIRIITRADRGDRRVGGGVIEAFEAGYLDINPGSFDYVCKFDLDLEIPPDYFASIMNRMEADPRLSAASGKPYFRMGSRLISERCGDEHCVGMIKFYRTAAFMQMGGFVRSVMWDGIDTHRCRMLGWKAASWEDAKIRFVHLRPMGTSHNSWWTGRVRHGRGQYFMGTSPFYMLASAVFRLFHPPMIIGSIAMGWGFLKNWVTFQPQYGTPEFRQFVRKYQWNCMLRGKHEATRRLEDASATQWTQGVR